MYSKYVTEKVQDLFTFWKADQYVPHGVFRICEITESQQKYVESGIYEHKQFVHMTRIKQFSFKNIPEWNYQSEWICTANFG